MTQLVKPVKVARAPKPLKRSTIKRRPLGVDKPKSRTSKRRKSRLSLRRECDKRFAWAIKERDGWACRACGRGAEEISIQCAHVFSRRYHSVRWTLANAVALCAGCHIFYTHDPLGWEDWCIDRFGEARYRDLGRLARQGVAHIDYDAILATLPEVPK